MTSGEQNITSSDWLGLVRELEHKGELIRAYDAAIQGLKAKPNDTRLKHLAVLALARAGDTHLALARYQEFGLERQVQPLFQQGSKQLAEDIAALKARILKDLALSSDGLTRRQLAGSAADEYENVFRITGGYYPAINAATLRLISGQKQSALNLARRVLHLLLHDFSSEQNSSYWHSATRAEAHLILGHSKEAVMALRDAKRLSGNTLSDRASTHRQLRIVCVETGIDRDVLNDIAIAPVLHYCGHIISAPGIGGRFMATQEEEATTIIDNYLDITCPSQMYGSLAAGADIIFAEGALARGIDLHVVLPFKIDQFEELSVRPSGQDWVERFQSCIKQASSIKFCTEDEYLGDDQTYTLASRFAMGLAILRSRHLDTTAQQAALWDGGAARGAAGTAIDVETWRRTLRPQTSLRCKGWEYNCTTNEVVANSGSRVNRAILFGDLKGFSKLSDRQLPNFVEHILGTLADVLSSYEDNLCYQNTWGDGLFMIFKEPVNAAECALEMQRRIATLPLKDLSLPDYLSLRLGIHFGPVLERLDPVVGRPNYFGSHVSRTARIEPITPEGSVYVTEHFAAAIAIDPDNRYQCDYVGNIPMAKGYGSLPMYLLRQSAILS